MVESTKELKQADNDNEKVKASLSLAESVTAYDPAREYEVLHLAVDIINQLPSPEKEKEKLFYLSLLPVAESLIKTFRLAAAHDNQNALNLAQEIRVSE